MDKVKSLPKRKQTRLKDFDYSSNGAYFLTLCTENHSQTLSQIVGGGVPDAPNSVELLSLGKIVEKNIITLNDFYSDIKIDSYVIMPNHIHLIVFINKNSLSGTSGTPYPTSITKRQNSTLSKFISTFKRFVNKEYGKNVWQRSFYDHVIRDEEDYLKRVNYITENPTRWAFDKLYLEE